MGDESYILEDGADYIDNDCHGECSECEFRDECDEAYRPYQYSIEQTEGRTNGINTNEAT